MDSGIYLIISFNWPRPYKPEYGQKARALHDVLADKDWIEEVLAASGGIGAGASSWWIFKLENYAALDRLLHDQDDPVAAAYASFFSEMEDVQDMIREEVLFL
jgi:hypothetical protein